MSTNMHYTKEFKLRAIGEYKKGMRPIEIWIQNNIHHKDNEYCRKLLVSWRKKYTVGGEKSFDTRRGRKALGIDIGDPRYLEAKIVYLEEENRFLRKLRARRAE